MDNLPKAKENRRQGGGKKRETDGKKIQRHVDENSPVVQNFIKFQQELDFRYDKRERIIKLSRDVTIFSKRVIFALHRPKDDESLPQVLADADSKVDEIRGYLEKISLELIDEAPYKFARAYSGGMQEFVEAVTFLHYIKTNELLNYGTLCKRYLSFDTTINADCAYSNILLTPTDYILGIADLTGELMRMCINQISTGNHERAHEICFFLRELHDQFLVLPSRQIKDFKQKMTVLGQSLKKVENACYNLQLRGMEVPSHMLVDMIQMRELGHNGQSLEYSYEI